MTWCFVRSDHHWVFLTIFFTFQGETKILKLKNLRPQDYANYSCIASVRNVCNIPDKMVSFRLSNRTGMGRSPWFQCMYAVYPYCFKMFLNILDSGFYNINRNFFPENSEIQEKALINEQSKNSQHILYAMCLYIEHA